MRLPTWNSECQTFGREIGITVGPGVWAIGVYWDDDPITIYMTVPLVMLSIERNQEHAGTGWKCCWLWLQFLIGKQELRLELDLRGWLVRIKMIFETDDLSIHLGPLDHLGPGTFW